MDTCDVAVVGAGPTGLMLACELAMRGVDVRLLERRREESNITRAFAVHARTLELLDARGLADQILARGYEVNEIAPAPGAVLKLKELDTRYPMILICAQSGTEKVLQARAGELGVRIDRGYEVREIEQDSDGVTINGDLRAKYVVGCDGAHSKVRTLAKVDFTGKQYETHILLADVKLENPPDDPMFARNNDDGAVIVVPFGDNWFRAIAWDVLREREPLDKPVGADEMRDAFRRIAGEDFGMSDPRWSTRFLSERRQAEKYRVGRVFLAGDAAHVHSPLGGQGMNTGIQDAMNLGWKLAAAVEGKADLLGTYEAERHPVGAQVLKLTDGFNQLVLGRSPVRRALQTFAIRMILHFGRTRRAMGRRLTGLGIGYPGHRRADDTTTETGRLYELLRAGEFVLVSPNGVQRDDVVHARCGDTTMLVRPDGYVAWESAKPVSDAELAKQVERWCGRLSTVAR